MSPVNSNEFIARWMGEYREVKMSGCEPRYNGPIYNVSSTSALSVLARMNEQSSDIFSLFFDGHKKKWSCGRCCDWFDASTPSAAICAAWAAEFGEQAPEKRDE